MRYVIGGLTRFAENPSHFPVSDYAPETKKMLLDYMKSFEANSAGGLVDDCKTGELVMITNVGYEDEEFMWTTQDIYHIEKYNATVNPDFITHVRKRRIAVSNI